MVLEINFSYRKYLIFIVNVLLQHIFWKEYLLLKLLFYVCKFSIYRLEKREFFLIKVNEDRMIHINAMLLLLE